LVECENRGVKFEVPYQSGSVVERVSCEFQCDINQCAILAKVTYGYWFSYDGNDLLTMGASIVLCNTISRDAETITFNQTPATIGTVGVLVRMTWHIPNIDILHSFLNAYLSCLL